MWSLTIPETPAEVQSGLIVLRCGITPVDAFNSSDAMLSVRESMNHGKGSGSYQAVLIVCVARNSEWKRTITISPLTRGD